jgi:Holliday junction resolvase RusA-like endonuclease
MICARMFAEGVAVPQGSHKAFVVAGRARITDDNAKTRTWRDTVAWAFRRDNPGWGAPRPEPVEVYGIFLVRRPASDVLKTGALRKGARLRPTPKHADLDKLQRAIGDALNMVAWVDDSQIVRWNVETFYSRGVVGAGFAFHFLEDAGKMSTAGLDLLPSGCMVPDGSDPRSYDVWFGPRRDA